MGNDMRKAYTYKKTIKRAACAMLAAGLVFTGCPEVFLSQFVLKVNAAQGYESLVKSCIDNINTFDADDENTYLTEIINGLESDEIDAANKYVEELMRQSDYYWLNLCFISDFIGNSVLWYSVKDKYVNKDNTIDKITAKNDYIKLHTRLDNGEWKELLAEEIDKACGRIDISDWRFTTEKNAEMYRYLNDLRVSDRQYYWIDSVKISDDGTYIKSVLVSAKDKYTNENNQTINKEQAGNDFDVLQKRLKNGEEMKIIEERITEGKYSVALPYNVYTVQLRDLKINKDRAGDIYNYVGYLSTKPQYSYINFILREYDEDYLAALSLTVPAEFFNEENKFDEKSSYAKYNKFNKRIADLTAQIDDSMSDLEKTLAIYEWAMRECEYDYKNFVLDTIPTESYQKEGVVYNGLAVCSGYADFMEYMLRKYKITNYIASSSDLDHAWNIVNLDGINYHLDATWDDVGKDSFWEGVYNTDYFLKSDDEITELNHYGWSETVKCDKSDSYEGYIFRNKNAKQFNYYNGYWYYICNTKTIVKSKIDGSEATDFKTFKEIIGMYIYDDYMYIATRKDVYKINMKNQSESEVIFKCDENEGFDYIDEFVLKQGKIKIDSPSNTKIFELPEIAYTPAVPVTYGDANGDGKIDSRDAVLIKKYVAGFTGFTIDLEASDVNADGKVDTRDAVKILKKIAGFDVTLGAA